MNHDVTLTITVDTVLGAIAHVDYWVGSTHYVETPPLLSLFHYSFDVNVTGTGQIPISAYVTDLLLFTSDTSTATVKIDRAAPSSTFTTLPPIPGSDPATSPVSFDLRSYDGASGVDTIYYRLSGATTLGATVYESTATGTPGTLGPGEPITISNTGTTTVTYWSVDFAGNAESPKTRDIAIGSRPALNIAGAPSGWVNHAVVLSLDASASAGQVGTIAWTVDGAPFSWTAPSPAPAASQPVTITAEGVTTLDAAVTDLLGSKSDTATAVVRIDTGIPESTITVYPSATNTGPVDFGLDGSDATSGISALYYKCTGASTVPTTAFTTTVTVSVPGTITVEYWSLDNAGNESTHHFEVIWITGTFPDVQINGAPTGWVNHDVVLSVEASEAAEGVDTVFWSLAGTPDSFSPGGLPSTCSVPVTVTAEGDTSVKAWASNGQGTVSSTPTADVRIDRTDPETTSSAQPLYFGPATISIEATDPLSGVGHTYYQVNGRTVTEYTAPFMVSHLGTQTVEFYSVDNAGNQEATKSAQFFVSVGSAELAGLDRYQTAVAVSRSQFATGSVPTVVVATGQNFPDALAASPLAGAYGSPVLLTRTASLPSEVALEIIRLGSTKAVIVGGTGAVKRRRREPARRSARRGQRRPHRRHRPLRDGGADRRTRADDPPVAGRDGLHRDRYGLSGRLDRGAQRLEPGPADPARPWRHGTAGHPRRGHGAGCDTRGRVGRRRRRAGLGREHHPERSWRVQDQGAPRRHRPLRNGIARGGVGHHDVLDTDRGVGHTGR